MTFCTRCGKQIEEGQICSCSVKPGAPQINTFAAKGAFDAIKMRTGMTSGSSSVDYEQGQLIVPHNVAPSEGEIPVKQYNVAVMANSFSTSKVEGRMQVTNKRVLFRATGKDTFGKTMIQHEFAIDEIAGIEAKRNKRVSIAHVIVGLLIIIAIGAFGFAIAAGLYTSNRWLAGILTLLAAGACCVPFFSVYEKFILKLFALSCGTGMVSAMWQMSKMTNKGFGQFFWSLSGLFMYIILIITFIYVITKPNLVISVKNKGAMGVVDIKRKGGKGILGGKDTTNNADDSDYDLVMPTPETDSAIREIGAIVLDIQKLGDMGIEKWTKK